MKNNKLILLSCFLFVLLFISNTYYCEQHSPSLSNGKPGFWLDLNYYQGSQNHTQLEIYYSISSNQLFFKDTSNYYLASVNISFTVTNNSGEVLKRKSLNRKLKVNNYKETEDVNNGLLDILIIDLLPGNYNLEVKLKDINSSNISTVKKELIIPSFNSELQASTIQFSSLITEKNKGNSFIKGNKTVIPNPSRNFTFKKSLLYLYYEIYNLDISNKTKQSHFSSNILVNNEMGDTLFYKVGQSISLNAKSCIQTKTIDIRKYKPDNYYLSIIINDITSGKSSLRKSKFTIKDKDVVKETLPMTESDIEKYRDQVKYFATENELDLFDKLNTVGKRNFLINFWRSKDKTPGTPTNEFMLNSFARIDYANKNFQNGLNSDMGRVFIIYGQPDEIENRMMNSQSKSYIVWEYFATGTGKQQFVFVDRNATNIYQLVHSTVEGEIQNPNWMNEEIQK